MYFNIFERIIVYLRNLGNRKRYLKPMVFVVTPLFRLANFFYKKVTHNVKKYVCLFFLLFLFFLLCPHFFIGLDDKEPVTLDRIKPYDNHSTEGLGKIIGLGLFNKQENYFKGDEYGFRPNLENFDSNKYAIRKEEPEEIDAKTLLATDAHVETQEVGLNMSADDWRLMLVNKQHHIPEDYEFELGTIYKGMKCDARIIDDLNQMIDAAALEDILIIVCSPYRNDTRQETLFDNKIEDYRKKGMSYMESYHMASTAVTIPGSSEHQIGLALDLISSNYTNLDEGFAQTTAGKWLAEHSWEYGFTLRYPKDKEYITGIEYEPWHFRYVGVDAAKYMKENGLCLEELIDKL